MNMQQHKEQAHKKTSFEFLTKDDKYEHMF